MRSERRNISVTNEEVSRALDSSDNVSKYIERAILFYLDHNQTDYADAADLEEVKRDIQILNRNYTEMRDLLSELANAFMK